jgi:hypothetical protein
MKGRFDPLLTRPYLTWVRDSFEHCPLAAYLKRCIGIVGHRSSDVFLKPLFRTPVREGLRRCGGVESVSRLKQDSTGKPYFVLPFRKFWEHVSAQYGNLWGHSVVLIPIRVSLLILAVTSCNDRGIAEYNRIHTGSRSNLEVSKVRDLLTIKHYGPKSVHEYNAKGMYERWLRVISEGSGVSSSAKRRNLAALL